MIKIADISKDLVDFTKNNSKAIYEKTTYLPAYIISNLTANPLNIETERSSLLEVCLIFLYLLKLIKYFDILIFEILFAIKRQKLYF